MGLLQRFSCRQDPKMCHMESVLHVLKSDFETSANSFRGVWPPGYTDVELLNVQSNFDTVIATVAIRVSGLKLLSHDAKTVIHLCRHGVYLVVRTARNENPRTPTPTKDQPANCLLFCSTIYLLYNLVFALCCQRPRACWHCLGHKVLSVPM